MTFGLNVALQAHYGLRSKDAHSTWLSKPSSVSYLNQTMKRRTNPKRHDREVTDPEAVARKDQFAEAHQMKTILSWIGQPNLSNRKRSVLLTLLRGGRLPGFEDYGSKKLKRDRKKGVRGISMKPFFSPVAFKQKRQPKWFRGERLTA